MFPTLIPSYGRPLRDSPIGCPQRGDRLPGWIDPNRRRIVTTGVAMGASAWPGPDDLLPRPHGPAKCQRSRCRLPVSVEPKRPLTSGQHPAHGPFTSSPTKERHPQGTQKIPLKITKTPMPEAAPQNMSPNCVVAMPWTDAATQATRKPKPANSTDHFTTRLPDLASRAACALMGHRPPSVRHHMGTARVRQWLTASQAATYTTHGSAPTVLSIVPAVHDFQ